MHIAETSSDHSRRGVRAGTGLGNNSFPIDALHIFILFGFAFVQPLFDVLSRSAQFFVAERSQPADIVLVVVLLCVLLPSFLVLFEGVAGLLHRRLRKGAHLFFVATLLAITCLPALNRFGGVPGFALLLAASLLGVAGSFVYGRFQILRLFMTYLSVGLVVIPGNFLLNSDVTRIVFPAARSGDVEVKLTATPPIVMVVFDELPLSSLLDEHHQIDPIRYPNFAALARDSYWFRNATTVADGTPNAVPALLSGIYPTGDRLPTAQDYPNNLFTLLGDTYELRVFESLTQLCRDDLCGSRTSQPSLVERMQSMMSDLAIVQAHILLPADLSAGLPALTNGWNDFAAAGTTGQRSGIGETTNASNRPAFFEEYVASIEMSSQPRLYFLHTLLPHVPWQYLPSGKSYGLGREVAGVNGGNWTEDEWAVIQGYQRHLLQLEYTDSLLGKLLERLKVTGVYDEAMIIVVADHGGSFRAGDLRRELSATNFAEVLPIPLLIKLPGQTEGVISDQNVQSVDILPTIADVLNITMPWEVAGRSVFDTSRPEPMEKVAFNFLFERFVYGPTIVEKYAAVDRKLALFGAGTEPHSLFRIGEYEDLIGRRVDDLRVNQTAEATVRLDAELLLVDVDLQSNFVPARITGLLQLSEGRAQPSHLAVAVNGTIWALTQPLRGEDQQLRFSALVPEAAFRSGSNEVEILLVSGSQAQPQLQATTRDQRAAQPAPTGDLSLTYAFTSANGRVSLTASDGRFIPVVRDAIKGQNIVTGYVGHWTVDNGVAKVNGWAADIKNFELPEAIVVFANGTFVYAGRTTAARPDVVKQYGTDALLPSGFDIEFPVSVLGNPASADVRVFAISRSNVASELKYASGYPWRVAAADRALATYDLSIVDGREVLVTPTGEVLPVEQAAIQGYVGTWKQDGPTFHLSGWAADVKKLQIADSIVAFVNGQFLAADQAFIDRPDVVQHFKNQALLWSGFVLSFPVTALGDPANAEVRIFAISEDGVASELIYQKGYPWPRRSAAAAP